jgi:tetratricopeptide (TPR) repeat protein
MEVIMWRILAVAMLLALYCAACATVGNVPTDARLAEAQKAFDEGQRRKDAGQYTQAVSLAEHALELREAVLGGTHPEVASCLDLLGDAHRMQRNYAQADPLLQRALAVREAALGKNHPDVARSLNNLAILYSDQGNYAQSEAPLQRALAIREAALGRNHLDTATSLNPAVFTRGAGG